MSLKEPSFLYIDDDPASREVVRILLQRVMGYHQLTLWENSADFPHKIQTLPHPPTVIFFDLQIRPYNGYEMLAMLRQEPRFAHTIPIALTANVMASDVEKMQQHGFAGLIGKPISNQIFPRLIHQILARESVWYIS